jgi:threonine synthase
VPSGNFGNLTAGVIARTLGVPIARFVAATTINDTVPRYLDTGVVSPKPSVRTLANAMDVGDPSNLERLRWLFHGDVPAMRAVIAASVHTDEDVRTAIRELDQRYGYVVDPHTAIAYLASRKSLESSSASPRDTVFLATAHPAKFREVVEPAIGRELGLPAALAEVLELPRTFTRIPPTSDALAAALAALDAA